MKLTLVGTNWIKTTLAGKPNTSGYADGPGTNALFVDPNGLAVDQAGNVYVCDQFAKGQNNSYIRMIAPDGMVTTIAGGLPLNQTTNSTGDGVGTNANIQKPFGIAVDSATNLYIGDGNYRTVRKLTRIGSDWSVTTVAGHDVASGDFFASMSGVGTNALFGIVTGVAADNSGNVYAVDISLGNIYKITSAGLATAIAGPGDAPGFQDGTGDQARFNYPSGVTLDSAGNLYVADRENHVVRKITSAGLVITLAGQPGVAGELDGIGNQARFSAPRGIVTDGFGNIYVTDTGSNTVRKITSAGVVSTIAGSGIQGYADGVGASAQFNSPAGIAIDTAGNLYVVDQGNACIRLITPDHVVSTIAGLPQLVHPSRRQNDVYYNSSGNPVGGYADGVGTNAFFNNPSGIVMDSAGNLYVADTGNFIVRKLTPLSTTNGVGLANWMVTTLAGVVGVNGSIDGTGANAKFGWAFPNLRTAGMTGITVDSSGNLYVTDDSNNTIRKISPSGVVTTLAGTVGIDNSGGTDGTGDDARFNVPYAIAVDAAGSLYVADLQNQTIRKGTFAQYGPANLVSFTPASMNSSLKVTLLPPEAFGQWRFPWEIAWHNSGDTVSNLVAGNYIVEFQNIAGLLAVPASVTLPVTGATFYTNLYYPTIQTVDTNNGGSLTVTLGPNPSAVSGWGFLGASPPWFSSGYTTNLVAGNYLITFRPVSGRVTPQNLSLQVSVGQPTYVSVNYLLAQSAPGGVLLPTPVPVPNISDVANYPFGFNGQLTSDTGNGSGVAVAANVVLTAAHVVFNDQTLNYVDQVYWHFRREVGTYEPQPLAARGSYILSGYASQRTNDLQIYAPDTSTPQSRNLDVAALYFLAPVAGGGYSGYLPSDASPNTWLAGAASKMLVGYPVDGSQFGDASIVPGKMYQTQPSVTPLTLATDPVVNQQVYKATWFLGYPGNSGGPFYVQFNGYYYPAGVYLGTLYNGITPYASAVRAIDSDVVNLITQAGNLGDSGTNFTGGGVITLLAGSVNSGHPAYIQVNLGPAGAVSAGAGWRLQGDASFGAVSNYTRTITSSNAVIEFKPVNGWNLPTNQSISLTPGQLTIISGNYTLALSVADLAVGMSGPTNVSASNNLVYTLLITNLGPSAATGVVVTNTLPAGVAFISASGGGVSNAGVVTWPALTSLTNGGTTNFTLTVKAPTSGKLTNTVSVGSSTSDTNVANNTGKLVTLVIVSPPVMVANMANGMGLSGTPGTTYRIEYRNSFTNGQWLPLKTNTVGAGVSYFVSPWPPTNRTPTFYRALWLP